MLHFPILLAGGGDKRGGGSAAEGATTISIEAAIRALSLCIALCTGAPGDPTTLPDFRLKGERECVRCRTLNYKGFYLRGRDRVVTSLAHDGTIAHELVHRYLCRRKGVTDPCDKDHDEGTMWRCASQCEDVISLGREE